MHVLGLDIGGANIKAADVDGRACSREFALWKHPELLSGELEAVLREFDGADHLAVTMTGELADCFRTKAEGVDAILTAVESAAGDREVSVWQTGAEFVSPEIAREIPLLVAAANWHVLATWLGRMVPEGPALLIDIGSTTTDIIPLQDGRPVASGMTDRERLLAGELVYLGTRRTPLCALARAVPFGDSQLPLAAELFATTLDLGLLLGDVPEESGITDTANGQPATVAAAHDRLARMFCCDVSEFSREEAVDAARFLQNVFEQRILAAIQMVLRTTGHRPRSVLLSGSGAAVAERIIAGHTPLEEARRIRLDEMFATTVATSACAFAAARLATERVLG